MKEEIKVKEWALVTGASSGIGKTFAEKLAQIGFNLILIARREEKLNEIKENLISKYAVKIEVISADLSDRNCFLLIEENIKNKEISLLVNNAGFGQSGSFLDNPLDNYIKMIDVNCTTPLFLTKTIAEKMKKRNKGSIIFIGSILGLIPTPYNSVYSATKAFEDFLASSLWYELKEYNINVLCVNPGTTKTEFHSKAGLKQSKYFRYPEQVVDTALKKIYKKPSIIDGFINKIIILLVRIITRKQLVTKVGNVFYKLQKPL
ncbi:MAG: SDR family oxidoreductase [bacterium]